MLPQNSPAAPIVARSREAIFFHYRDWPADPGALLERLVARPEPVRYVTVPWDTAPLGSITALEQAVRAAGGQLRLIEYVTPSPEADELGFRLAMTLHADEEARAAGV